MRRKLRTRILPRGLPLACAVAAVACLPAAPDHLSGVGADLIIVPQTSSVWPHEPAGFTVLGEQPFDALEQGGWHMIWNDSGYVALAQDPTAPFSPPNVARIRYPAGFAGGAAPGTAFLDVPAVHEIFVGLWLKVSDPWQGHASNVNKIQFLFFRDGGDMPMVMYGVPGGPYELRAIPQFPGLPTSWLTPKPGSAPFTLGQWHRIEWLVAAGGPGAGTVRWWVDGRLVGDHTGVPFTGAPLATYKLSPTWGGTGDAKTENDAFVVDHLHISGR